MFHHAQLCVLQIQFKLIVKHLVIQLTTMLVHFLVKKKYQKNSQLNNCKYKRQQKAEYRKQY